MVPLHIPLLVNRIFGDLGTKIAPEDRRMVRSCSDGTDMAGHPLDPCSCLCNDGAGRSPLEGLTSPGHHSHPSMDLSQLSTLLHPGHLQPSSPGISQWLLFELLLEDTHFCAHGTHQRPWEAMPAVCGSVPLLHPSHLTLVPGTGMVWGGGDGDGGAQLGPQAPRTAL